MKKEHKKTMKTYDVLIAGCGAAGLYCALNLPDTKKICMICKGNLDESDSYLAQGGICMLRGENDYESYFEDTLKAGHYENDPRSVDLMIRSSNTIIKDLIGYGVRFQTDEKGDLTFTKEGAHSKPRILFHEDQTGREITTCLLKAVQKLDNVEIHEHTMMVDLLEENGQAAGLLVQKADQTLEPIYAQSIVLACGGIGGLYENSTNFPSLTGDALAICLKHHIELENIDYIQIHPTTLYSKKKGRRFLLSESLRGEGALLYDVHGNRFTNELLPRDVVSAAIKKQMKKDDSDYVYEDLRPIGRETLLQHFPNICSKCLEEGYDVFNEPVPVVPAQHYFMGGVKIDLSGRTSMPNLYACGETSCNKVHGANRLASNSLLESLVFARRAADDIVFGEHKNKPESYAAIEYDQYGNISELMEQYKKAVLSEIERVSQSHE